LHDLASRILRETLLQGLGRPTVALQGHAITSNPLDVARIALPLLERLLCS